MVNILTPVKKSSNRFSLYNLTWPNSIDPLAIEMDMIRHGGQWTKTNGETAGMGLHYHFRKFQEIVWPERIWQKGPFKNHWAEKCLEAFLSGTYIGVMGCAASGKSDSFGCTSLTDWYCHCTCTTVLVSSTDLKSLELRIWGMIKKYHRLAKASRSWIPGHLIEGKQMLILDPKSECPDGRDFKNGIIGVATKRGNQYVGLGSLIGIHNDRVRIIGDELQLCPRAFLDSAANLSKCKDFKLVGLGNPNETTNAHGVLCEPASELGGWEGGVDQTGGTKIWKTRFPNGITLQLPGSDSPNNSTGENEEPPFPFLITPKQMRDDAQIWGTEDWHYTMMNEARMPRGQGARRVLTRQMCTKFGAFKEPNWRDSRRTSIAFLDAAYRGVGGDRCVFGELQFGYEVEPLDKTTPVTAILSQNPETSKAKQIVALIDLVVIPISAEKGADTPEDQIATFVMNECEKRRIPPENFFFDSGMRTSLVTTFSRVWSTAVNSIDCGGRPTESAVSSEIQTLCKDYYSKFVTELWFSVRMVVECSQFRGMSEEAATEFSQREWKLTGGNKIEVESKEEMKLKTGRSPDLADAVAIGVFGARRRGFVITKALAENSRKKRGPDWRDELRKKSQRKSNAGILNHSA